MTKYSKAVAKMNEEGIRAFLRNGDVYVSLYVGDGKYMEGRTFDLGLSLPEIEKWADRYDNDKLQKMKDSDPFEVLEEIARIFHYRGWDLGDSSGTDTDFIHSSDKYLELVYKAFNPIYKK